MINKGSVRVFRGTLWDFLWRAFICNLIFWGTGGIAAPIAVVLFFATMLPKTHIEGGEINCMQDDMFYRQWIPAWAANVAVCAVALAVIIGIILSMVGDFFHGGEFRDLFRFFNNNSEWWLDHNSTIGFMAEKFSHFGDDGHSFGRAEWWQYIRPGAIAGVVGTIFVASIALIFTFGFALYVLHKQVINRLFIAGKNGEKIRPTFNGRYFSVIGIDLWMCFLFFISLGLLLPVIVRIYRNYIVRHVSLPSYTIHASTKVGPYYRQWWLLWIIAVFIHVVPHAIFGWNPRIAGAIYSLIIAYFAYNWFFSGLSIRANASSA